MPNVFVPMHQPLLSRSKALALPASWPGTLRAATSVQLSRSLSFSLSTYLSLTVIRTISLFASLSHYFRTKTFACTCVRATARERAHRGRGPHVRPYGHGDESNRHRSARISPTGLSPSSPWFFLLTLLAARQRRSACFFNAKCSLLFVRVYGRFGREAVARPALFSNAKRALRTHPYRVTVLRGIYRVARNKLANKTAAWTGDRCHPSGWSARWRTLRCCRGVL